MSQGSIQILDYEPPQGWIIRMWIGKPGHFTCPHCGGATHVLLVREGEFSYASTDQRCDACVPRLRSVG